MSEQKAHVKEFKRLWAAANKQFDKYEEALSKYNKAKVDADAYGTKPPKMPAILKKKLTRPNHEDIARQAEDNVEAKKTGGTRRRHRKHRSTRRRH